MSLHHDQHSYMNAGPLLNKIAKVFAEYRLEAVMVGNATAPR